jgi:hypothetical protein
MSQSVPPPGNPFAEGAVPPAPFTPPPPVRNNLPLGLATSLVATLVAAGVYGGIIGAIEREIGFLAIGVGFVIGFAAGKVGGPHPVLPIVAGALSLGAVYLGQILGLAILIGKQVGSSTTSVLFDHLNVVTTTWRQDSDLMSVLFFAIAAFAAFSAAKKATS